jgi:hypothetical protein
LKDDDDDDNNNNDNDNNNNKSSMINNETENKIKFKYLGGLVCLSRLVFLSLNFFFGKGYITCYMFMFFLKQTSYYLLW